MVLVRIRLETITGEVKFFKPLLTLPSTVSIGELCTTAIGEKIGLTSEDWKNYAIYEAESEAAGPPKRKVTSPPVAQKQLLIGK